MKLPYAYYFYRCLKSKMPLLWAAVGVIIVAMMIWDMLSPSVRKHEREVEESRRYVYEREYKGDL